MQGRKKRMMALMLIGIWAAVWTAGCKDGKDEMTLEQVQEESQIEESQTEEAQTEETQVEEDSGQEDSSSEEAVICVYVCGQVEQPGVYEFSAGSRVFQAVEAAGGMLEEADETFLNQAERMEDGQRVYIPSKEEVRSGTVGYTDQTGGGSEKESSDSRVNINTAGKEELMTLTGIGEAKAEAIMKYRDANGGFQRIEELMEVEGIKEGTFEKIKEDIMI